MEKILKISRLQIRAAELLGCFERHRNSRALINCLLYEVHGEVKKSISWGSEAPVDILIQEELWITRDNLLNLSNAISRRITEIDNAEWELMRFQS